MGYGTQVPDPAILLAARMSKLICHTCMKLVCRECLYQKHKGNPNGLGEGSKEEDQMHEFEPIEDFKVRVKQTVWMINSKLDASIIKLKHLQARFAIATGQPPEEEDSDEE